MLTCYRQICNKKVGDILHGLLPEHYKAHQEVPENAKNKYHNVQRRDDSLHENVVNEVFLCRLVSAEVAGESIWG